MLLSLFLTALFNSSAPQDTLRLTPDAALGRALAASQALVAADARARAATAGVQVAGAWRNPTLSIVAENLGSQRDVTGYPGLRGTEGQATLGAWLPLGGDRGASLAEARARAEGAAAGRRLTEYVLRAAALDAIALAERDAAMAAHAGEEADALQRFATSMTLRAAEGRTAGGEAARARLEADLAVSRAARRAAEAARSYAELTRLLGAGGDSVIVVEPASCAAVPPGAGSAPELGLAEALRRSAEATVALERARRIPDLFPQLGLRRSAGYTGLLLGVSLDLPLLTTGRSQLAAAQASAAAARADLADVSTRLAAERRGAEAALARLEAARERFGPAWRGDLERTLASAIARYEAGEATIAELLDARKARIAVLDEYQAWRAERRLARVRAARLTGAAPEATSLCDDESRSE